MDHAVEDPGSGVVTAACVGVCPREHGTRPTPEDRRNRLLHLGRHVMPRVAVEHVVVELDVVTEPQFPDRARGVIVLNPFDDRHSAGLRRRRHLTAAAAALDHRDPEPCRRRHVDVAPVAACVRRGGAVALEPCETRGSALVRLVVQAGRHAHADLREVVSCERRHVDQLVARMLSRQKLAVRRHDLLVRRRVALRLRQQLVGSSGVISELVPLRVDVRGDELVVVPSTLASEDVDEADRHGVVRLHLGAPPTRSLVVDWTYD